MCTYVHNTTMHVCTYVCILLSHKPLCSKCAPSVADVTLSILAVSEPVEEAAGCVPVATVVFVTSLDDANVGCGLVPLCKPCCCVTSTVIRHVMNAHMHTYIYISGRNRGA